MTPRKATKIPPPPQWLFLAIAVAFLILSTSTCHAGWRSRAEQEKYLPPEKYSNYAGEYQIMRASVYWITMICQDLPKNESDESKYRESLGCARMQQAKCIVLIAFDEQLKERGWDYDIVLKHELGHCAGGKHDGDARNWQ